METLVRELEALRTKPHLTNDQMVGVMLAAAIRFKEALADRTACVHAIATALAMQPQIDATKFHEDFAKILAAHFEPLPRIPQELQDMVASIKLVAADRLIPP